MKYTPELVRARITPSFRTDCCSFPGRLLKWLFRRFKPECTEHDAAYCTRLHGPGDLDQAWRDGADQQLGRGVRARTPCGLRCLGWLFFRGVHRFGGDGAYDSCGLEAGLLCRHGQPAPLWMAQ